MALTSGFTHVPLEQRDVSQASSFGTDQPRAVALDKGVMTITLGIGGSYLLIAPPQGWHPL